MNKVAQKFLNSGNEIIFGKEEQLLLCLCCLIAKGHLLIEDVPGVGKTTLAKYLAKILGLEMGRVQFTNDLLPMDLLGGHIFSQSKEKFEFHPGPIFCQVLLADELNRATPKTQSALLQVMEEKMVTIDGENFSLPQPFFVMATQNPREQIGTHSLPESQLDRFLMKISLGFPNREAEKKLFKGKNPTEVISTLDKVFSQEELLQWQQESEQIHVSEAVLDYLVNILEESRQKQNYTPLSPRAGLDLLKASKAWAYLQNRDHVLPDDIKYLSPFVLGHRLTHPDSAQAHLEEELSKQLLSEIKV